MDSKIIIGVVIVAALALGLISIGGIFDFHAPDSYYDYSATMSPFSATQPITISVFAQEKAGNPISSCNATYTLNEQTPAYPYGRCGSDHSGSPWCQSQTNFNARSIRVLIDGQTVQNLEVYPSSYGVTLSSPFTSQGAVCCWGVPGACSVCNDQANSGRIGERAYVFFKQMPASTPLSSASPIFTLQLTAPLLQPGDHTLDVYYYAETLHVGEPYCQDVSIPIDSSALAGAGMGDANSFYNEHQTITFTVAGSSTGNPLQNQTQNTTPPAANQTYSPPLQGGGTPAPAPGQAPPATPSTLLLAIAAILIFLIFKDRLGV